MATREASGILECDVEQIVCSRATGGCHGGQQKGAGDLSCIFGG